MQRISPWVFYLFDLHKKSQVRWETWVQLLQVWFLTLENYLKTWWKKVELKTTNNTTGCHYSIKKWRNSKKNRFLIKTQLNLKIIKMLLFIYFRWLWKIKFKRYLKKNDHKLLCFYNSKHKTIFIYYLNICNYYNYSYLIKIIIFIIILYL